MVVTLFIPDDVYAFFEHSPNPRKALEAAVLDHFKREQEHLKEDPYQRVGEEVSA